MDIGSTVMFHRSHSCHESLTTKLSSLKRINAAKGNNMGSFYHDNHNNSVSAPGNGLTDAPTKTLTHYGAGFSPISEYDSSTPDQWPQTHLTGWQGPDDTARPGIAGYPPNIDTPS